MEDSIQTGQMSDGVFTSDFLTEIIQASEKRADVIVKSVMISNVRNPSDEFISQVRRLSISAVAGGSDVERHVIAKVLLPNREMAEFSKAGKFFDKEDIVYSKLIPALKDLQPVTTDPIEIAAPKMFKSVIEKPNRYVIVLEDCSDDGFISIPFHGNFDLDHCKVVVEELAKLHAISVGIGHGPVDKLKSEFGILFQENHFTATNSVWEMVSPVILHGILSCFKVFQSVVKDKSMLKRVDDFIQSDIQKFFLNAVKPDESFNVFCHGDPNIRNIMFKYEDGSSRNKLKEIKLLDFQLSRYASPAYDLAYFLFHNTTTSFHRKNIDRILAVYYDTFMNCLKKMNTEFPGFTFNVLLDRFKQNSLFGILMMFIVRTIYSPTTGPPDAQAIAADFSGSVTKTCEAIIAAGDHTEIVECLVDAIDQGLL